MEKILIIEDEGIIRQSLSEMLGFFNYEVICAADGKAGLAAARSASPDLILCDVMMPEMDGFSVLKELRKNTGKITPFVFLTAKVQSDDISKGKQLGADAYLFKPCKTTDLLKTIREVLDKNKQEA